MAENKNKQNHFDKNMLVGSVNLTFFAMSFPGHMYFPPYYLHSIMCSLRTEKNNTFHICLVLSATMKWGAVDRLLEFRS